MSFYGVARDRLIRVTVSISFAPVEADRHIGV